MYLKLYAIMLIYHLFVPPVVPLAVGPGTTVVNGPRNKDGTINYVAAINHIASKGVTAKNNAFVVVAKLMPPDQWGEQNSQAPHFRAKVFAKLGVPVPGKGALYFHPLPPEPTEHLPATWPAGHPPLPSVQDRFAYVANHPWTNKQYPKLARWLDANGPALDKLVAGVKRSRYYAPLVSSSKPPEAMNALLPWLGFERTLATALCDRAEREVARGHLAAAWQQALTVHRLGRDVAKGTDLISLLIGVSIETMAQDVTRDIVASPHFTKQLAVHLLQDRSHLLPHLPIAHELNVGERFMGLDTVMMLHRDPEKVLGDMPAKQVPVALLHFIDPNIVLADLNKTYDRIVHVAAAPSFQTMQQRSRHLDKLLKARFRRLEKQLTSPLLLTVLTFSSARTKQVFLSHRVADLLEAILTPAIEDVSLSDWKICEQFDLGSVAIALGEYRVDHHQYPAKLAALVPAYLPSLPDDLFTGKPLNYVRHKNGSVLLYSVGADGKDNGGKPAPDDLPIHLPAP